MSKKDGQKSTNRLQITEGVVKKGGVNKSPSTVRPAPPTGQGSSGSSSQGGSGSSA